MMDARHNSAARVRMHAPVDEAICSGTAADEATKLPDLGAVKRQTTALAGRGRT
jgi:hypothetical protein